MRCSAVAFCHRRLASVYPLYLLGVCISLAILAEKGRLFTVRPSALLSQIFLMQAWLPSETEHALQVPQKSWFGRKRFRLKSPVACKRALPARAGCSRTACS